MLFIVAREDPALLERLRREFADEPDVVVLLDRRHGDRRRLPSGPWPNDRRRGQRRRAPEVDERLRSLGWAIAHVPPP